MMTMIRPNPTVQIPPTWDCDDDDPPYVSALFHAALQRYLPSEDADADGLGREDDVPPVEAFLCDQFRMYEFKVRKCARGRSHDWTDCPFAHPGEKARRRDPCGFRYSGIACPDFRKGGCKKGHSCEFAHGVFECWLHPDRYRTQPCKDGLNCRRRVCFFAHTPEQLRVVSPRNVNTFDSYLAKAAGSLVSPLISVPPESPPLSPSRFGIRSSVNDLIASIRNAQIGEMKISPQLSILRPSCYPVPSTPQIESPRYRLALFNAWDNAISCATVEEEVPMERVESGRDLRERMYAKLSKEHSLERTVAVAGAGRRSGLRH